MPANKKFLEDAIYKYSDTVFRVAFPYVKNRADAEDISQEVFLQLLKKCPPLTGEQLKAWLIRVTINKSKDFLRARKHRDAAREYYEPPFPSQYEYSEVFDELNKLPEKDRNVLYLYYYEGYTAWEIAGIIGGNERAVTKRIGRAREKLKHLLNYEY